MMLKNSNLARADAETASVSDRKGASARGHPGLLGAKSATASKTESFDADEGNARLRE
jgi:hypothetical protein